MTGESFEESHVFEILILSLDLKPETHSGNPIFSKTIPSYSFFITDAIKKLGRLYLEIDFKKARTNITLSIYPAQAYGLLRQFFRSKLLHCPRQRTESVITHDTRVQVTPKGTALVYTFCKNIGIPPLKMPDIVKSNFNTMDLFCFERTPANEIIFSKFLLLVLFMKLMGPAPNVWSPQRSENSVSCIFDNEFPGFFDFFSDYQLNERNERHSSSSANSRRSKSFRSSPFHHKYFTNPESDSHVQYYTSDAGLRLVKNKWFVVNHKKVAVDYCFSGKALCQWLLDCTTVEDEFEAITIGSLLVAGNFITPITLVSGENGRFQNDRAAFYMLTEMGAKACLWSRVSSGKSVMGSSLLISPVDSDQFDPSDNPSNLSLMEIITDPGLRALFTMHMSRDQCAENMKAYTKIMDFVKLERVLRKLLKVTGLRTDIFRREKTKNAVESHFKSCFSQAFHLYSAFISDDAQININIDSGLREHVHRLLIQQDAHRDDESECMATPIVKSEFFCEDEKELSEDESFASADESTRISAEYPPKVGLMISIYLAFTQIARSLYRLMEIDSYPKFMKSEDYFHLIRMRNVYSKARDGYE